MKTKIIILTVFLMLLGADLVKADLVFDSGYNIFDDTYPYYDEVAVFNDAHLDVLGGSMGRLELWHYATANIYAGDIRHLLILDNAVVNIYGAGDTLEGVGAGNDSLVYLYAYDVTYHPTGGLGDGCWIEGTYIRDDLPFAFSCYNDASYSHINIVPEPTTFLLLGFGGFVLTRRKRNKSMSQK